MKGVDLFCGCGGLTLGFMNAGIEIVGAYDHWEPALGCYRLNFEHPARKVDLADVKSSVTKIAKWNPDIIIGGPPCQDFSSAGKREEKERANLTVRFAQIVAAVNPKWFVMENVDRAQSSASYQVARKLLSQTGYGLTEEVLNACHFGVPQNRRRFFCIGLLGCKDGFLSDDIRFGESAEPMTIREYFDKIDEPLDIDNYYRHPRSYMRRAVFSVDEPSPTVRGVNRPVPGGYQGHNGDKDKAQKTRPLSTRERAIIQTFPKEFKLPHGKSNAEQLLGNAVPVKLSQAVADAILGYERMSGNQNRGRKASLQSVCGIHRAPFMRWLMKNRGIKEKSAKDAWSWLSRAIQHIELGKHFVDEDEMIYYFERSAKKATTPSSRSRMKKSLRYFWDFKKQYFASTNPPLLG